MKKATRKSKKSKAGEGISTDARRYLGALSEMHKETLKGIKEGFVLTDRKMDSLHEEFSGFKSEVGKKVDNIANTQNLHTEMIGTLMEDSSAIRIDLKRKVDYDEFLSLVKRVQKLETKS